MNLIVDHVYMIPFADKQWYGHYDDSDTLVYLKGYPRPLGMYINKLSVAPQDLGHKSLYPELFI